MTTAPRRWGDYTEMTIDPDGETFWYLGEYSKNTGTTSGRWGTYIGSYSVCGLQPRGRPDPDAGTQADGDQHAACRPTPTNTPAPALHRLQQQRYTDQLAERHDVN